MSARDWRIGRQVVARVVGASGADVISIIQRHCKQWIQRVVKAEDTDNGCVIIVESYEPALRCGWLWSFSSIIRHRYGPDNVQLDVIVPDVYGCQVAVREDHVEVNVGRDVIDRITCDEQWRNTFLHTAQSLDSVPLSVLYVSTGHIAVTHLPRTVGPSVWKLTWAFKVIEALIELLTPYKDMFLTGPLPLTERLLEKCESRSVHGMSSPDPDYCQSDAVMQSGESYLFCPTGVKRNDMINFFCREGVFLRRMEIKFPGVQFTCDKNRLALQLSGAVDAVRKTTQDIFSYFESVSHEIIQLTDTQAMMMAKPDAQDWLKRSINDEDIVCTWKLEHVNGKGGKQKMSRNMSEQSNQQVTVISVTAPKVEIPRFMQVFHSCFQTTQIVLGESWVPDLQSYSFKQFQDDLQKSSGSRIAPVFRADGNQITICDTASNCCTTRGAFIQFFYGRWIKPNKVCTQDKQVDTDSNLEEKETQTEERSEEKQTQTRIRNQQHKWQQTSEIDVKEGEAQTQTPTTHLEHEKQQTDEAQIQTTHLEHENQQTDEAQIQTTHLEHEKQQTDEAQTPTTHLEHEQQQTDEAQIQTTHLEHEKQQTDEAQTPTTHLEHESQQTYEAQIQTTHLEHENQQTDEAQTPTTLREHEKQQTCESSVNTDTKQSSLTEQEMEAENYTTSTTLEEHQRGEKQLENPEIQTKWKQRQTDVSDTDNEQSHEGRQQARPRLSPPQSVPQAHSPDLQENEDCSRHCGKDFCDQPETQDNPDEDWSETLPKTVVSSEEYRTEDRADSTRSLSDTCPPQHLSGTIEDPLIQVPSPRSGPHNDLLTRSSILGRNPSQRTSDDVDPNRATARPRGLRSHSAVHAPTTPTSTTSNTTTDNNDSSNSNINHNFHDRLSMVEHQISQMGGARDREPCLLECRVVNMQQRLENIQQQLDLYHSQQRQHVHNIQQQQQLHNNQQQQQLNNIQQQQQLHDIQQQQQLNNIQQQLRYIQQQQPLDHTQRHRQLSHIQEQQSGQIEGGSSRVQQDSSQIQQPLLDHRPEQSDSDSDRLSVCNPSDPSSASSASSEQQQQQQ
ncbi:uncharacterized protein LOC143292563 [Babylonia areolata]|uniref:uncharacterized protein LOC143292563 n=1 Tax=Babylonia areolata TaxID=304850 RepID=UPI003FD15554